MIVQAERPMPRGGTTAGGAYAGRGHSGYRAEIRRAHPLRLVLPLLLAGAAPLFLGGLLSDLAYGASAEPQWSNFAAWLVAGAMVLAGVALLWTLVTVLRYGAWRGAPVTSLLAQLAVFVLGFVNSLVHARDAWGIMPLAPILSALVFVLSAVALVTSLALVAWADEA